MNITWRKRPHDRPQWRSYEIIADDTGEADLMIADLQPRFGVPVVLMGQEEDGTPVYYGNEELKERLAAVPVDRMPWKEYA